MFWLASTASELENFVTAKFYCMWIYCRCWQQLVHLNYAEDARILSISVSCTVFMLSQNKVQMHENKQWSANTWKVVRCTRPVHQTTQTIWHENSMIETSVMSHVLYKRWNCSCSACSIDCVSSTEQCSYWVTASMQCQCQCTQGTVDTWYGKEGKKGTSSIDTLKCHFRTLTRT